MEVFDWSAFLANIIPQSWRDTRGKDVKVALIDTGVDFNIRSLGHLDKPGTKFFVGKPGFTVLDHSGRDKVNDGEIPGGHGTRLAGIIAGKSNTLNQEALDGLANGCTFITIKARHNFTNNTGDFTNAQSLVDGIHLAAKLGAHVAICAQSLPVSEQNVPAPALQEAFKAAENAGMLLVNSVENRMAGESWKGLSTNFFPANQPNVIRVAAAPADIQATASDIKAESIHFLLGGCRGKLYGTGNRLISPSFSNSYAVAVFGSVAALCISFLKSQGLKPGKNDVIKALGDICQPLSAADGVYAQPIIFKNF
jgi:subtilisin family serine protease